MSTYDNTNRFVLFRNDKEGGNEKWPDYKGSLNVDGVEYWLSGWIKDGKSGKFLSGTIKPKEDKAASATKSAVPDMDDEIPF